MTSETLIRKDLATLRQEKGNMCVSIIVPTHRLSPGRRTDAPEVEKAIAAAVQALHNKYGKEKVGPLAKKLASLYERIDFTRNKEGVGLFVSPGLELLVKFPFTVTEKIITGDSFEIRDLLYMESFSRYYFVLLIAEKELRLFRGSWNNLSEITDDHFPLRYHEEYAYSRPAPGTSFSGHAHVKSFEKDKSVVEEIRYKDFFRKGDHLLGNYITGGTPLIIAGSGKETGWFEKVSGFKKNIIRKIDSNYSHLPTHEIAELVWPLLFEHLQHKRTILLKEFEEKTGEHLAVSGIQQVWQAANQGNSLKLLVEKDFRCPGFLDKNRDHLYLRPPRTAHTILADAVDDLIEMVLDKKGQVFFTDNDMLRNYQRIAMITRY